MQGLFCKRPVVTRGGASSTLRAAHVKVAALTITNIQSNQTLRFDKASVMLGCGPSSDVKAEPGPDIAAEHAVVEQRRQGVFCRALVGEEVFDSSACYLDGTEMRPKVNYLLGSGSIIALGHPSGVGYRVEFEEQSGKNPMLEMMMQGMASGNAELAKALKL